MTAPPGLVSAWRTTGEGRVAESVHPLHVAVCTPDGALYAWAGDAEHMTPLRSCLKPFQAQPLFLSGAVERFHVSAAEVALACASHQGAPLHTHTAERFLARLGLSVEALMCGAHPPGDAEGLADLAGRAPTALHNNCSGKHAGMLASALALGAPTRDYLAARHPVQVMIRDVIALTTARDGEPPSHERAFAIDGCSAPTPIASVRELATMFARLASPSAAAAPLRDGLERTFDAMKTHPELVGGRGVIDTRLMRALEGVVAKRGADGVYALAVRERPGHPALGIALKVMSGSDEARLPAVMATLEALDLMVPAARVALKDAIRPLRLNHRQLVVGHWEAELELQRSA